MPPLLASLVRDFAQKLCGIVFVWLGVHVFPVPDGVQHALSSWVVLSVSAGALFVWTALVRWCETAKGDGLFAVWRRALGRVLMLGLTHKPVYVDQAAPAAPAA